MNAISKVLAYILSGGPLDKYKRQLGILLIVLGKFFPALAGIDIVDGISDAELLVLWGFVDAEIRKNGVLKALIVKLASLLKKVVG